MDRLIVRNDQAFTLGVTLELRKGEGCENLARE